MYRACGYKLTVNVIILIATQHSKPQQFSWDSLHLTKKWCTTLHQILLFVVLTIIAQ